MAQSHRGRHLVYVLSAGTAGARECFFKIDIANPEALHSIAEQIHTIS